MINRAWNWLLGIDNTKLALLELIDLVEQRDKSPHGGFVRLNNDLSFFIDDYKEKEPVIIMAYAYARRAAVAGMFFQGLVGKDLFDYVFDIFKKYQLTTGTSVDFQEQAGAQGMDLVLRYAPEMNLHNLRLMTGLAAQGFNAFGNNDGLPLENNQVITVGACSKILNKTSKSAPIKSPSHERSSQVESFKSSGWKEGNVTYEGSSFTVADTDTGDILAVKLIDSQFHGLVVVCDQELTLPLQPWPTHSNPFQDDTCFNGSGMGPNGPWSFNIVPTIPFSTIMKNILNS